MSPPEMQRWPLDTKLFAVGLGAWALHVLHQAFFNPLDLSVGASLMLFGGMNLVSVEARVALLAEAAIFSVVACGIYVQRRWALLMAFALMADIVLSRLLFVLTNLYSPTELSRVVAATYEGPILVALALYLWIRSKRLVFGWTNVS